MSDAIMLTPAQRIFQFGRFTLDPNMASLCRDGRQLAVRPKSFDVLVYLARNPGRVVSKDELMEAVWPNIFVTDNSLVQCISDIRAALDDEAQAILKTVARRGYLFAAPVAELEPPAREPAQSAPAPGRAAESTPSADAAVPVADRTGARSPSLYALLLVAGLALLPLAGAAWWLSGTDWVEATRSLWAGSVPAPDLSRPSIAVLPFDEFGGDSDQLSLGDALAEHIITSLSKTPKMLVIARNSTFAYKGRPVNVQEVSRELGARYVLEGSVQRLGNRVRIAAQLIDSTTGYHGWGETYDRDLDDIFALQDEIALDVVTALQVELTEGEVARIRRRGTANLRAWLLVNQSFEHMVRFTKESNERARAMAEEALALDPDYAEAYVRLGRTHLVDYHSGWVPDPAAALRRAIEAAQRALALDPDYPDTYHLLSAIYLYLKRHDDARLAVAKALELSPNHSLAKANLGMILTYAGEAETAINVFKEAMRLSPIFPGWFAGELGRAYFQLGRHEEAIEALQRRLRDEPDSGEALILLAASQSAAGRTAEARAALDRFLAPRPHYTLRHYAAGEFYKNDEDLDRVLDALRQAGLPE